MMTGRECQTCFFEDLPGSHEPCTRCGMDNSMWQAKRETEPPQPDLAASAFAVNSDAMEPDANKSDPVNHPSHYTRGGIECIDAIRAALTAEEWRGYCKGNAIKYIWRERYKGGNESLEKADWYLCKMAEVPHG